MYIFVLPSTLVFINFILSTAQEQRNSVPQSLKKEEIKPFLQELKTASEEWKAMKLIILGKGRIGKTTTLHVIKDILKERQVCHKRIVKTTTFF
jgi:hypothetical protein